MRDEVMNGISLGWTNKRGMAIQVADPERARGRRGHQDLQHARQVLQPQRRLQGAQGSGEGDKGETLLGTLISSAR